MKRRSFLTTAAAGSVFSIFLPKSILAAGKDDLLKSKLAGGVFYTADSPGRWAKKVNSHLPKIVSLPGGKKIKVVTTHPVSGFKHYIVKHIVLDKNFDFMAEHMFDPLKEKTPQSEFDIAGYKGVLYVMSVCNKHDTWINSFEIK